MRRLGLLAMVLAVCCACGAGPSNRPYVAVEQGGDVGGAPTTTEPAHLPAPPLEVPKTDLVWRDCTSSTLSTLNLGTPPNGLVLECGDYSAPIDGSGEIPGTFTVGAMKARLAATPADAPPLVLTSGSDRSSTGTLAALAVGGLSTLLSTRPVVAVDRRGVGTSTTIECLTPEVRRALADLGQFSDMDGDAVDKVTTLGRDGTVECTDYLQPQELAFTTTHAADDLEALRETWDVDTLGLLGTGNGASVVLSYAAKYPSHVGRLILDSPSASTVNAAAVTEQRVQGEEAAMETFLRQCVALNCSLGSDPRAIVTDVLTRARKGELAPLSANALLTAISGSLAVSGGDQQGRVRSLADSLAAAARGDTGPILAAAYAAELTFHSDGQLITRCTDGQQWPTPDRARELQKSWAELYPIFGAEAAVGLMACTAWPPSAPPALPSELTAPVLLLSGSADPLVGNAGLGLVVGTVSNAGAATSTMTWHGSGHPATGSDCIQKAVVAYAADGVLPADGSACPA